MAQSICKSFLVNNYVTNCYSPAGFEHYFLLNEYLAMTPRFFTPEACACIACFFFVFSGFHTSILCPPGLCRQIEARDGAVWKPSTVSR